MNKHNTTINSVIAATKGAEMWAPVLTGAMAPKAWVEWVNQQPLVTTRSGWEISPARSTLNGAQFAMSNIALGLRAATDLKGLPYTLAVKHIKRVHDTIQQVSAAFAAVRKEDHREITIADLTLLVKEGAFDEMRGTEDAVTEEELLERGFDYEQIEEFMELQAAMHGARQSGMGHHEDMVSTDEGEFRTAFHEAKQLWDVEPQDVKYAELAYARVALIGVEWPTEHPLWGDLLGRLISAWSNTRAYMESEADREAHDRKVDRRLKALEDLQANPAYARWAINHVARRIWRDMQVIQKRGEDAIEAIHQLEYADYLNERHQVPTGVIRRRDEGVDRERVVDLLYREVREDEIRHGEQTLELTSAIHDGHLVQINEYLDEGETRQMHGDIRFYNDVVDQATELLEGLTSLYAQIVKMELALAPIWKIFQRDGMPAQPPVYWNAKGFYHTEEDAKAALSAELDEFRRQAKVAEGNAFAEAVAMVLAANG